MDLDRALAFSRYAQRTLAAEPGLAPWLDAAVDAPVRLAGRGGRRSPPPRTPRRSRRRCAAPGARVMLHTLARDLTGRAPLAEVCAAVTRLAEVAIDAAVDAHHRVLAADLGEPVGAESGEAQRLVVVGMGKLGGGELNVSSDVDLVFVYPEEGETSGAAPLSNREFFERLGRRVIAALHEVTAAGYVFRVDMRLRPYGDSGPLAVPFAALEQYLAHPGTRLGALRLAQGAAAHRRRRRRARRDRRAVRVPQVPRLRRLRGPARRAPADPRAGGAARLRAQRQARRRRHPRDRVHRAGAADRPRRPRARPAPARDAARARRHRGAGAAARARSARGCARPTRCCATSSTGCSTATTSRRRTCPRTTAERTALAHACDLPDLASFDARMAALRRDVDEHFAAVLGDRAGRRRRGPARRRVGRPRRRRRRPRSLAATGFADPAAIAARLRGTRSGVRYQGLPALSRERFDTLVPQLLGAAVRAKADGHDPDAVFERLMELLETVSRRSAYLALLIEHPPLLPRLANLMGASAWAADYLTRHPILLDELLDARLLFAEPDWSAWRPSSTSSCAPPASTPSSEMDALRHFQHAQSFRLLVQDLAGQLTVERLADHLSALADVVLGAALRECWRHLRGADARAAALRRDRLRQARRQGAGLRLRPRPRVPLRRRRARAGRRRDARALRAPRAAPGHLAHQHDRGRAALRHRPAPAAGRRERPAGVEPRVVPPLPARPGVDVGAPGADARALRRRRRRPRRRLRGGARRDPAPAARSRAGSPPTCWRCAAACTRAIPNADRRCSTSSTTPAAWSTSSSPCSTSCSPTRTRIRALTRNAGNIALLLMAGDLGLVPAALAAAVADAYRAYRRQQHAERLTGARARARRPGTARARTATPCARCGATSSATPRTRQADGRRPARRGPARRSATISHSANSEDDAMSMAQRDGWIWYDGKLVPWREATTHVLTHTLHYGMGVFEGVRCYKTDDGPGDLPTRRPHRPPVPLGADLRHEDPVLEGGGQRGAEGMRARATSSSPATSARSRSTAATRWAWRRRPTR